MVKKAPILKKSTPKKSPNKKKGKKFTCFNKTINTLESYSLQNHQDCDSDSENEHSNQTNLVSK